MAPNQQSLAHITESLSNLDLSTLVKSEFLPLTHLKAQQEQPRDVTSPSKPASSDDYWSWTPSVETAEIEETFSASHMEDQLLRDAQRRSQKVETVYASQQNDVASYWDEAVETDTTDKPTSIQAQHEAYWEWESDAKDVFSSESIVDNLVSQSEHLQTKKTDTITSPTLSTNYWDEASSNTIRATRTHASYWKWESTAKQELIDMIRKQKEAQKLTSASHIEKQLHQAASDAYWNEAPVETASDAYWNWESTPAQVASTGAATNYWDW